jgi:hypothetical protein
MWPGLDRKTLPAGGRGLVLAALALVASLSACAPPPPEVDMNMPVFLGPFFDPQHCDSTGGGWLVDKLGGYSLWQMEQMGVDDLGFVQFRYEVRSKELACPVSYVNSVGPSYIKDGLSGSLSSAWLWHDDVSRFKGASQREFEIFLQECAAASVNNECLDGSSDNPRLGVWANFSNMVNGGGQGQSIIIINGKVFDSDTGELLS